MSSIYSAQILTDGIESLLLVPDEFGWDVGDNVVFIPTEQGVILVNSTKNPEQIEEQCNIYGFAESLIDYETTITPTFDGYDITEQRSQIVYKKPEIHESDPEDELPNVYSLCEVFLDSEGRLKLWTQNSFSKTSESIASGSIADIKLNNEEDKRWLPVEYNKLKSGMKFQTVDD